MPEKLKPPNIQYYTVLYDIKLKRCLSIPHQFVCISPQFMIKIQPASVISFTVSFHMLSIILHCALKDTMHMQLIFVLCLYSPLRFCTLMNNNNNNKVLPYVHLSYTVHTIFDWLIATATITFSKQNPAAGSYYLRAATKGLCGSSLQCLQGIHE